MTRPLPVHGTRRSFIRSACAASLGACALAGAAPAPAVATRPAAEPDDLPRSWIAALLPALAAGGRDEARRALHEAASAHFEALDMPAVLDRFQGDLPAFLKFLREDWGWLVEHDPDEGVVLADENKDVCVCPLVAGRRDPDLAVLCYCSEGFAERMFSHVTGAPARAEVTSSILRGNDRCRYRVRLSALA